MATGQGSEPQVSGLTTEELLGFGGSGEVWRARTKGGEPVALRVVAEVTPAVREGLATTLVALRSLASPHLVGLRRVVPRGRGVVLVLDHPGGGNLRALLALRPRLTAGQVVTAVAPLAQVLDRAHGLGLTHGRLGVSSVLLDAEGRPVLDGLGQAALWPEGERLDPTGALGASADVWGLGTLAVELLAGAPAEPLPATVPAPLRAALLRATAADPRARGTAAELAAALLAACPAEPLPLPPAGRARARHVSAGRRGPGLRVAVAAGIVALVVAGGWAWGHGSGARPARLKAAAMPVTGPPVPVTAATVTRVAQAASGPPARPAPVRPTTVAPDWRLVVQGLETAREQAFATTSVPALDSVWTAGAGRDADAGLVTQLAGRHLHATGLHHQLTTVVPRSSAGGRAVLQVRGRLAAYALVGPAGAAVQQVPAGPDQTWTLVLVRTALGWRLVSTSR